MNGSTAEKDIKEESECFSGYINGWSQQLKILKGQCSHHRLHCVSLASKLFLKKTLFISNSRHAQRLSKTEVLNMCVLIKSCQNISGIQSFTCSLCCFCTLRHTHTHTEVGISRRSLLCEARGSVTDPSLQNKDLSSAVILSLQTRGFCMGLAEPGLRLLFISSVIKGFGSITCLW